MPKGEGVTLIGIQRREAEFKVAADHRAARTGDPVGETAKACTRRESDAIGQEAQRTQQAEPDPP